MKTGTMVEQAGIYWCTVCKLPVQLEKGAVFPQCKNKCGRGAWELVQSASAPAGEKQQPR